MVFFLLTFLYNKIFQRFIFVLLKENDTRVLVFHLAALRTFDVARSSDPLQTQSSSFWDTHDIRIICRFRMINNCFLLVYFVFSTSYPGAVLWTLPPLFGRLRCCYVATGSDFWRLDLNYADLNYSIFLLWSDKSILNQIFGLIFFK